MNFIVRAALGTVIAAAFLPVHAEANYRSSFELDAMPLLRTGIPGYDGAGLLNGQWHRDKFFEAEVSTREQVGTTPDPVTGVPTPVWGNGFSSGGKNRSASSPHSFGNVHGSLLGPSESAHTSVSASVSSDSLNVAATTYDVPAEVTGRAQWNRDFWLEAGTTITFAGLATLWAVGDTLPSDPFTSVLGGHGESFTSLIYADALDRARVEIGARLTNLGQGVTGLIEHATGPGGWLSLTITNTGTSTLHGNLSAGAFLNTRIGAIAAPVPEPGAWLMLLGGAALVGGAARRRAAHRMHATV